jgi:hypothetical protein
VVVRVSSSTAILEENEIKFDESTQWAQINVTGRYTISYLEE